MIDPPWNSEKLDHGETRVPFYLIPHRGITGTIVVAIRLEDCVGSLDTLDENAWLRSFERQTDVEQRELCLV